MSLQTSIRFIPVFLLLFGTAESVASETIPSRFPPPPGFERVRTETGTLAHTLQNHPLLPDTTPARDWRGYVVLQFGEIGGVLRRDLLGAVEQCADVAIRFYAEHAFANGDADRVAFHSLSGQIISWSGWLGGTYAVSENGSALRYQPGARKPETREQFDCYLRFVMNYANTASLARDWPMVRDSNYRIGDVLIQPHFSGVGIGHLSIVVDACENRPGERRYIFVDGYMPARMVVVRQRVVGESSTVWMTPAEYLEVQRAFGPGGGIGFPDGPIPDQRDDSW